MTFKAEVFKDNIGQMQDNGEMGITEKFNIVITNESDNIVFSWSDTGKEEMEKNVAKFNEVKGNVAELKVFVAEIKSRYE